MARTAEGAAVTQEFRGRQLALRAETLGEITQLWSGVEATDLRTTMGRFAEAAAAIVLLYARQSQADAGEYVLEFRAAEGVAGLLELTTPAGLVRAAVVAALRAAGLGGIVHARKRGESIPTALDNGLVKTQGQAGLELFDAARGVVLDATRRDRASRGLWQRITSDRPCAFCAMLASRGPVYNARTVGFETHPHCACLPEPAYPGTRMPAASARFADLWDETGDLQSFRRAIDVINSGA